MFLHPFEEFYNIESPFEGGRGHSRQPKELNIVKDVENFVVKQNVKY
jgi:hypothetical protein